MGLTPHTPKARALHGMPADKVRALAERIIETGAADTYYDLAERFGCSRSTISNIVNDPLFVAFVKHKLNIILQRDGKSVALSVLFKAAREADRWPDRIRAAELLLSRTTPPAAPASSGSDGPDRDLAEMSVDELRQVVDQMQSELANRSQPVNAPDSAPKQIDLTPDAPINPFD